MELPSFSPESEIQLVLQKRRLQLIIATYNYYLFTLSQLYLSRSSHIQSVYTSIFEARTRVLYTSSQKSILFDLLHRLPFSFPITLYTPTWVRLLNTETPANSYRAPQECTLSGSCALRLFHSLSIQITRSRLFLCCALHRSAYL